MIDLIKENLMLVGQMMIIYFMFAIANVLFGVYLNVTVNREPFDFGKLLRGIIRFLALGVGMGILTIAATSVPVIFAKAGITIISDDVLKGISVLAILFILAYGIVDYARQAIEKINAIFNKGRQDSIEAIKAIGDTEEVYDEDENGVE